MTAFLYAFLLFFSSRKSARAAEGPECLFVTIFQFMYASPLLFLFLRKSARAPKGSRARAQIQLDPALRYTRAPNNIELDGARLQV